MPRRRRFTACAHHALAESRHVVLDEDRRLAEAVHDEASLLGAHVGDRDPRPLADESAGGGAADAAGPTRDQRDLAA